MALRRLGPCETEFVTDCSMVLHVWGLVPDHDLTKVAFSEMWCDIFDRARNVGLQDIRVSK
eukprot:209402-Pyramimonas_sp.AAC.1